MREEPGVVVVLAEALLVEVLEPGVAVGASAFFRGVPMVEVLS
jgi:hypothetical protein